MERRIKSQHDHPAYYILAMFVLFFLDGPTSFYERAVPTRVQHPMVCPVQVTKYALAIDHPGPTLSPARAVVRVP